MADDAAAAGLQSLAHLMARVQRAAAQAHRQRDTSLHTLRAHESDVSCPPLPPPLLPSPPSSSNLAQMQLAASMLHRQGDNSLHNLCTHKIDVSWPPPSSQTPPIFPALPNLDLP